jgi:hypothetical protein
VSLPPTVDIGKFLGEMPSPELFELAEQMESLQGDERWVRLQDLSHEAREKAREALEFGPIREQADYARWMGFINGFRAQPDLLRSILTAAAERRRELEREAAAERDAQETAADRA